MTFEQPELPIEFPKPTAVGTEVDFGDHIGHVYLRSGACPSCHLGYHSDCYDLKFEEGSYHCCCPESSVGGRESESEETASVIERIKAASEVTDVTSTGRKRAALAYPITEGMICEWTGLKESGGGVNPIIGCAGNPAKARHHGPDKNTLNNTEGNVHRICHDCHNRWHAANDPYYGSRPPGTEPFIPLEGHQWRGHNPDTKATEEEIVQNEIYWRTHKPKKVQEKDDE